MEWDDVLKSWAIPKGLLIEPGEKHLAVHVEDHPLDYGRFEGVIPAKQYGAGKVIVWDCGIYSPDDEGELAFHDRASVEERMRADLIKGTVSVTLAGEKLKGPYRQSIAAFCRSEGLAEGTFYGWRARLRAPHLNAEPAQPAAEAPAPFIDIGTVKGMEASKSATIAARSMVRTGRLSASSRLPLPPLAGEGWGEGGLLNRRRFYPSASRSSRDRLPNLVTMPSK